MGKRLIGGKSEESGIYIDALWKIEESHVMDQTRILKVWFVMWDLSKRVQIYNMTDKTVKDDP